MRILKHRIYVDLLIGVCGILIGLWLITRMVIGIVTFFEKYGLLWGAAFSIVGILLIVPFIGFISLFLFLLKPHAKMLNLSIFIDSSDAVVITTPSSEFKVRKINIKHILKNNLVTTIVWSQDNDPDSIKTFFVRKKYFPKAEYEFFIKQLSAYECFSDNAKENRKISAQHGLNHIFRKNKLEYEL